MGNVKKLTPLRLKFDEVAYGAVKAYATRNELSPSLLSQVLSGKVSAENGGAGSIKIFKCFERDGIWEDEFFPWEDEYKSRHSHAEHGNEGVCAEHGNEGVCAERVISEACSQKSA